MSNHVRETLARARFSPRDRASIYRAIGDLVRRKVAITQALQTLADEFRDNEGPYSPSAFALSKWSHGVRTNMPLGTVTRGWIPDEERMLISVVETKDELSDMLDQLAENVEQRSELTNRIRKKIQPPLLMILIVVGLLYVYSTQVLPEIDQNMPKSQWTGMAAQLAILADYGPFVTALLAASIASTLTLIVYTFPRWTGQMRAKFDRYPPWSIYRLWHGTTFLQSFSALIKANVGVAPALAELRKKSSPWMAERLGTALFFLGKTDLGHAFKLSRLGFPDTRVITLLCVYATLPDFEKNIADIGRKWFRESLQSIDDQTGKLSAVLGVISFGIILWIALGIIGLMNQMQGSFTGT